MKSKVFACDMRTTPRENMLQKLGRLIDALDLGQAIKKRDIVAVKLHFGEKGNTGFIRPIFIRQVVDKVADLEARPFVTDANTLYVGARSDSVQHLRTAIENGFAYSVIGAPLIIADGLKGGAAAEIPINLEHIQTAYVAADIAEADAFISVAHFKLHELSGFGGAIKNTGMGCASRRGKLAQHSGIAPKVKAKRCIGCGECVNNCAQSAIALIEIEGKDKAKIDPEKCVGCGECILICPQQAIKIQFDKSIPRFMKKMVEYTAAVLKDKNGKAFFINFLTQISPACDCLPNTDASLVRDIGILASKDPIAIDQASVDLLNQETASAGTCLKSATGPGEDKIKGVYPDIDWPIQLGYGQEIGLGSRDYDLEWLEKKE